MASTNKVQGSSLESTFEECSYPSNVDKMMRADTDFEGTADSLPPAATNPIPGADGTLPQSLITKVVAVTSPTPSPNEGKGVAVPKTPTGSIQD